MSNLKQSSIDDEWLEYLNNPNSLSNNSLSINHENNNENSKKIKEDDFEKKSENIIVPECNELYISTKTKVLFLNKDIDIQGIFWKIPIIEYWEPKNGVIKKQIKIVSKTQEEYDIYKQKLENVGYHRENIIKQINNQTSRRVKFRDERKITIGISKKDIMNCRGKVKNAFYNCFAIIVRFKYENAFREIHIKVFNTGKLEIPGVLNDEILEIVKKMLLDTIRPFIEEDVYFLECNSEDNVLINSNFNCGFYINRDKLYHILRSKKYKIECAYDPCSYPGVKCKYYFNNEIGFNVDLQDGQIKEEDRKMKFSELNDYCRYTEISFMIFRTGSCLIVGNCRETVLKFVFEFIKKILYEEYVNIFVENEDNTEKIKKTKLRKKMIKVGEQGTISSFVTPPVPVSKPILIIKNPL
jgi:hypothetical protein